MSVIGPGSIVSGASVRESVLGRRVRVHSFATVEESVNTLSETSRRT